MKNSWFTPSVRERRLAVRASGNEQVLSAERWEAGVRPGQPIRILPVEDNPGDVRLTKEAFREGHVNNELHVVNDGVETLEFLRRENGTGTGPGRHRPSRFEPAA
jgi:stress response protein YsnF